MSLNLKISVESGILRLKLSSLTTLKAIVWWKRQLVWLRRCCKSVVTDQQIEDLSVDLLKYPSSLVAGIDYSPSELLRSKSLRTKLLFHKSKLIPKICWSFIGQEGVP